jgi:hypothetical protein
MSTLFSEIRLPYVEQGETWAQLKLQGAGRDALAGAIWYIYLKNPNIAPKVGK